MGRVHHNQTSFLGGALSPKVQGRVDIPHYQHGADVIENFLVNPQGGARRRIGSQYYSDITSDYSGGGVVLIPWIIDPTQSEVYLFYFKSNGTSSLLKGINTIDDTSLTSGSGLSFSSNLELDYAVISNRRDVHWTIAENRLIIVHRDRPPIIIQRNAKNDFSVYSWEDAYSITHRASQTNTFLAVPYEEYNPSANSSATLQLNVTGDYAAGGTLDTSYSVGDNLALVANGHTPFVADDVGTFWRMRNSSGHVTIVEIDALNDSSSCDVTVRYVDTSLSAATSEWAPQAWGGTTASRGWPRTVAYHESRLIFGGCKESPNTIWASKAFNIGEFSIIPSASTINDDDAKTATLSSESSDTIQWLSAGRFLSVGTITDEYTLRDINAAIPYVQKESTGGSASIQPVKIGSSVLYANSTREGLNEFVFDFDTDSFIPQDVMFVADHLLDQKSIELDEARLTSTTLLGRGLIAKLAYNKSEKLLWILDVYGGLTALTRDPRQKVAAFSYHKLGGTHDAWNDLLGEGSQTVVSTTILDAVPLVSSTGRDQLWLMTLRKINGSAAIYLEYIEFTNDFHQNYQTAYYVDCGIYNKTPTSVPGATITGLSHLEGEEIQIFDIDTGRYRAPQTVASGSITLTDGNISRAHVGLNYTSKLSTLPLEPGSVIGSGQATTKRIDELSLRLYNTRGVEYGPSFTDQLNIQLEDITVAPNAKQPVFTGTKTKKLDKGYDKLGQVAVTSRGPLPLEVLSILTRYQVNEV